MLAPGQPARFCHAEDEKEDFLMLSGECLLLVEGQERLERAGLRAQPGVDRARFRRRRGRPCAILAIGTRRHGAGVDPASELARRHGAGVEFETSDPAEAYAGLTQEIVTGYREDWLPG